MFPTESANSPVMYRPTTFNFVDLETKADDYLARIKSETERITREAKEEIARLSEVIRIEQQESKERAEKTRQEAEELEKRVAQETEYLESIRKEVSQKAYDEAYALGKAEGLEEGRKAGYADGTLQAELDHDAKVKQEAQIIMAGKLETLIPSVRVVVEQIQMAQQAFLLLWEQSAVEVASAIANRAISRQLPEMVDVPLRLLREALELAVGCSHMKIRFNPGDYDTLQPQIDTLIEELSGAAETEIIPDVRVSPGGCLLETSLGTIDQRIESRLDRIKMELV